MRALLQRVTEARVEVEGEVIGSIGHGLLILLGVGKGDDELRAAKLAEKCAGLRIFSDEAGRMNRSLQDVEGAALVVSQFTLYADCARGRRPYFGDAEAPRRAAELCAFFTESLGKIGLPVQGGRFGADMQVHLINDGPVTLMLEVDSI